ncbi:hypothetical protein HDV03_004445 [Kappamyces sp. JEL0829]|nr:hypothetical protein HDV03_004445 [Kappamyces sp. JEL0829]KAJ3356198.1 hypothetical protein HDU91_005572 [Kappamyces sp. JEL0680]
MSTEDYAFQLAQVKQALEKDPGNQELTKLHENLQQLLELLQQEESIKKPKPTSTSHTQNKLKPSGSSHEWLDGEMALGKWSDGSFYECMIIGRSETEPDSYEVVFTGYDSIQILAPTALKVSKDGEKRPTLLTSKEVTIGEIKGAKPEKQRPTHSGEKKKKKGSSKRDLEDKQRVGQWQAFAAKKSVMKKSLIGAVGSSASSSAVKSFTALQGREKHVFSRPQEDE